MVQEVRIRLSLVASIAVAGLAVTSAGLGGGVGPDRDADGVPSSVDNCELPDRPQVSFNPSQLDVYPQGGDGVGDACQSGPIEIRNGSSYALLEYLPQPGQPPTAPRLGTATGRRCDPHTACMFDDGPEGRFSYWYAEGTDKGFVDDDGSVWAEWTVEFHYRFAGHGDDATGPMCTRDANGDGYNDCFDEYTYAPWNIDNMHDATTPPNAGLQETRTGIGVETLTARDVLPCDQTPAEASFAVGTSVAGNCRLDGACRTARVGDVSDGALVVRRLLLRARRRGCQCDDGRHRRTDGRGRRCEGRQQPDYRCRRLHEPQGLRRLRPADRHDDNRRRRQVRIRRHPAGVYALVVHADGYEDFTAEDDPYDAGQAYVTRIE